MRGLGNAQISLCDRSRMPLLSYHNHLPSLALISLFTITCYRLPLLPYSQSLAIACHHCLSQFPLDRTHSTIQHIITKILSSNHISPKLPRCQSQTRMIRIRPKIVEPISKNWGGSQKDISRNALRICTILPETRSCTSLFMKNSRIRTPIFRHCSQ
jgi:hypothetical protein